ncbi:Eco57I restriction-modification methylase domain-containing protein [Algoriphagus zhangzhouensis]|uniref:site-specific DNA-methyltransferase (adenine-specific) n=1 Tax=Algoriphagus zhangzhouensis TaxID=1073327 RepID=A0A1M7Z8X7_9BACT|nr:N-6 DNA methylase [Algoriphagus zhangzhouensis]TDY47506.1 N-6 DNA methylase [Algoriphagus zhangzhouensis]SHO61377.1 N-6 DNA Methylase [Algoriphagus zhangzhouensis]
MRSLNQIFSKLGLSQENGLYITIENKWIGLFSNRVERLISNVIKPNAFFCIDKKPFILFFEGIENKQEKLKEIWNFNESPIVIIIESDAVEIYNGYNYISSEETLQQFGTDDQLTDFSYFELVTGKTWERYLDDFSYDKRVDFHLLENIKAARNLLISHPGGITKELANSLLGKIIFVRYLIDRKIGIDFEQKGNSRNWTNDEFCTLLNNKGQVKAFFRYLKDKFNGDLFPISDDEFDQIPDGCLHVIISLLSGNEIVTGQTSFFDLYDFSIIPVEFISNVYELFIGQNEQEEQGAYYTPLFLVDYILAETVEKRFRQFPETTTCKVLDPACGSGIFLVETLRKIIERFQKNNPEFNGNPELYKENLRTLVCENIYGIDKDPSAVNVAIFSIYLTLLDYQNPSDIETFKFPPLLNKNFFAADFFDLKASYNTLFSRFEFNFILGNPPWKRGQGEGNNPLFVQYISHRKRKEKGEGEIEIGISNREIAQAFVFRVSDFCTNTTKIALIATSKILYNLNAKGFRQYLLNRFVINKVFELAPVRKEVFDRSNDKAVGPAAVLFYQLSGELDTDSNVVEHIALKPSRFFSLFKVFTIQRNDYKQVNQKQLKEFDYLWKVLVYGSYLDFNLIRRLKESFQSIGELISNEDEFLIGQGAMVGGGDENDATHLMGRPFLNSRRDISAFWVNPHPNETWQFATVHRPRNRQLYQAPMLLVTTGVTNTLKSVSAVCECDVVFKHALTAIKTHKKKYLNNLYAIAGLINSSMFAYFNLLTFSSSGIEREQAHDVEKFSVPYVHSEKVIEITSSIHQLKKEAYSPKNFLTTQSIESEIELKLFELDAAILEAFSLTAQERDVVDYSIDVSIPIQMRHSNHEILFEPATSKDQVLVNYINLFTERLSPAFEKKRKKIVVEVILTRQIVGMFFTLAGIEDNAPTITWANSDNASILNKLIAIGSEKITDRLFIQKDVRGFEKDGFYIVKPNEKRLWYKAIGHLDVNEFANAMLTTGKNKTLNVR